MWVAAAGNRTTRVLLPASLENVIAVGSYNPATNAVSDYARYESVPEDRFVMAWGGEDSDEACLGLVTSSIAERRLFGTSFAAPLIAGVVAGYIAYLQSLGIDTERVPLVPELAT